MTPTGVSPARAAAASAAGDSYLTIPAPAPADVRLHDHGKAKAGGRGGEIGPAMDDAAGRRQKPQAGDQGKLARLGGVDLQGLQTVQHPRAGAPPMVEQGLGVEDRVFGVAHEGRHGDSVEDHRSRWCRVGRIEPVIGGADRLIDDAAAIEHREKRGKPEVVLVEDGEIGHGLFQWAARC